MKALVFILVPIVVAGVLCLVFAAGRATGRRSAVAAGLDSMGLTRRSPELLRQAAQIMHRLANPSDLDQLDILTGGTSQRVNAWLSDYKKETAK